MYQTLLQPFCAKARMGMNAMEIYIYRNEDTHSNKTRANWASIYIHTLMAECVKEQLSLIV